MHGKILRNAALIFLIAFLASAACGEHAANVIKNPTSAPAAREILNQKSLADIVADRIRTRALRRIKRKVGPKVRDIKRRVRAVKKDLASLAKDRIAKENEIQKLELAIEKFQNKHKPFDVDKHSRDVTIRLARKEISDSAPMSQPTTRPGGKKIF